MQPNEALEIVGKVKHFYRAFEKIEEVMQMIYQSDNLLKEIVQKQNASKKEIEKLSEQKEQLLKEIDANISRDGIKYEDYQKEMAGKVKLLDDAFTQKTKGFNDYVAVLGEKQVIAETEYKKVIDGYEQQIENLKSSVAEEETKLVVAKKGLDDIKSKMEEFKNKLFI
jgi:SMC interacting uncharacterized protein involved in chromosome segregation